MKLTGKCLKDFTKYLINQEWFNDYYIAVQKVKGCLDEYEVIPFDQLPESMQFGVIQDFAGSKGYDINIECYSILYDKNYYYNIIFNKGVYFDDSNIDSNSRAEARTVAIEKFNQMYNEG